MDRKCLLFSIAPMQCLRSTAGVAVLGDKLYVVGGRDGTHCHRSVEVFRKIDSFKNNK